ncbi:N-acetyl-D-Glu racemase DgcA [Pseudemcibacter aquimaris]|uniref:N-acetyl-D-Glu racemase DgcA n=1 Tax=Pseudemcibacter aquimaris TaxID=2857064 RepID=UPI00201394B2|nr:N-acetyl-D-Glu racemase DgcA [Pseudemcibacter aquimaris]MCC3862576.1 L-Ala-D/L-Glu epimerase [Pseudemcibacter aquimaris]WDU57906.1 L-Ala-D/L-Glu epimerase [Pseudemcibacter aquimaris]
MRKFDYRAEKFDLHTPFVISRGSRVDTTVIIVEIEEDGFKGWGESCPTPHYGESVESVMAQIDEIALKMKAGLTRAELQDALPAGAARNAIDCAMWDLEAKQSGKTIAELMGHDWPDALLSVETISIGEADKMGKKAKTLENFPTIKVKMNADDIENRIKAVHENAPNAKLIVDANESWNADIVRRVASTLKDNGVVMLEQPVPPAEDETLRGINAPLPLGGDESCHVAADLERLHGIYDVVNIKLDKTGGLTEAKKLLDQAKEMGFDIMVGCMVGTSLSMAAGMFIATEASYVDLDAPTMLATDRDHALTIKDGKMSALNPALYGGAD